ncbi:MAG: MFS transporter, partial [Polyangiales bacterium]
ARPAEYGRLSGRAWALGYAGGLLALAICYPLLPRQGQADRGAALGIYAIIAGWYLLFSLPALAWLPQAAPAADTASLRTAMRRDLRALGALWRTSPALRVFTVAYFLYNDAVVTVIQFTGMFTQEVLHFSARDNLWLFLLLNIVAVPGTLLFGRLFDRLSGVRILQLLMLLWTVVVLGASQVHSRAAFWPVAALAALILGATQAASRAQMARLAPPDASGRAMALLALSGKASAVLGPLLYGLIADAVAQSTGAATGHRVAIGAFALVFGAAAWILQSTARHSATPSQKA